MPRSVKLQALLSRLSRVAAAAWDRPQASEIARIIDVNLVALLLSKLAGGVKF